ncbi:MAG TPA: AAA family ATPase [Solirubrobacteraceae bacterium]|nr:AAA family ATPase [Solirubrobacteraceae bacterium]
MLEVRVLGGLSALVDGRPVELPADARARELLARLALSPGPHPRSALAGRLRPDVPEDSARKTLRNALYELRRALGPAGRDALVVTGERVGLRADAVSVDVLEFRRCLADGDLEAAASAGPGELLDGFDGDWALRARDEHAAELAAVLGTLAARAEEAGDMDAAVAWARRRLGVEPLAEAAHRELIRLLALGGDRAAALAAASAMSEQLRSQLGLAPSAATRALVEDVRRGRIAHSAAAVAAASALALPAALAAAERPEGREPALARLERTWADAVSGALRFALVTGEPGIGKTTLAGELARRAHAQGGAVLLGRSDEHALVPFQPWIEALERLLDALPGADVDHWLTAHGGILARLLPARSATQGPVGDPRERYLAFELVRALLDDVAARRPVLLVLDDVHWADVDSLSLLRHLARSAPRGRSLVVLCARSAELQPAVTHTLADLRREGPLVHVDLTGLDEEAVGALLTRRIGVTDHETARRFRARSGGNPFFLNELLREAREGGGDAQAPPAGVRDVITRRLARLDESTLRALDAAAVSGLEFDVTTVARVEDRPVVELLEALDGAIAAALVAPTDQPGRHAFAHALVAETIVAALPASRRARLHLRTADVLADRHDAGEVGAGEVVRHLRAAAPLGGGERLATWELAAAREATLALAHSDAAAHYEAALAARPGAADRERGEVLLALGDASDRAGRRGHARAVFAEAAELARAARDPDLLARAALGHGGLATVIAAADAETVRLLEEALAAAPAGEPATSARLLARLSVELYYSDRGRARELSALAVERARRADDSAALAAALNAHRVALWTPDHAGERLGVAGDMLAAAEAAGDRHAMLQARNWRVVDLLELGSVREAAAEIDAYEALANAVALPHFRWYVPLWRATLALLAGRWAEARELTEQALALGRRADDPNAPLFVDIQRHFRLQTQGRFGELDRARVVKGAAASPAAAEWLVYVALLDAETGATEDARRQVSELARDGGRALAMDANWHGACILADAAVQVGDREAAATLYALLEPHARLFPLIARAIGCFGSAEYYVGRLAGLLGRHDEAEARLRRAVAENDRTGAAPWAALALLRLGETLTAREQHDAARDILQRAATRARALDMPKLAADAGRLLGAPVA